MVIWLTPSVHWFMKDPKVRPSRSKSYIKVSTGRLTKILKIIEGQLLQHRTTTKMEEKILKIGAFDKKMATQ